MHRVNLSQDCLIFNYSVIIICLLIKLCLLILTFYIRKKVPKIQILLGKLFFLNKIIFIPLLVIVALALKHSWNISKNIQNSQASMNLGKTRICLSVLSLSALSLMFYSRILFDYDCRLYSSYIILNNSKLIVYIF